MSAFAVPDDYILGPLPCQSCGRSVTWTGRAWIDPEGLPHLCGRAVRFSCACGGILSVDDTTREAQVRSVNRHNDGAQHRRWRDRK